MKEGRETNKNFYNRMLDIVDAETISRGEND